MFSRDPRAPDTERLARLVALSRRLASETDLPSVLRFLLESAIQLTGAERGFFLFRSRGSVTCEASVPEPFPIPGPVPSQLSKTVLARVLDSGEPVLSTDLAADARFRARVSVRRLGLRSVLAVPFPGREGATGVLYLDSRIGHTLFRPEDLELLGAFAAQASLALEHASLSARARPLMDGEASSLPFSHEPPGDRVEGDCPLRLLPLSHGLRGDRGVATSPLRPSEDRPGERLRIDSKSSPFDGSSTRVDRPSRSPDRLSPDPQSKSLKRPSEPLEDRTAPGPGHHESGRSAPGSGTLPTVPGSSRISVEAGGAQPVRPPHDLVGSSAVMRRLQELIARVGPTELPVLIIGESGTGKELVARAIHRASRRRAAPFIAENCAAIPETLLESELFGSMRGAFTGAERDRDGLFRAADRGSLFLDEIGEMPLPFQVRLLRALQEGEVRPVGSPRPVRVDVRVIAATNRDPDSAIVSRRLRLDLYYRLAGMTLEIPPLRDRREDIPLLAAHFLARAVAACETSAERLSPDALARLAQYEWPGNVRELENEIERAAVLARGAEIEAEDLSPRLAGAASICVSAGRPPAERTMIEGALLGTDGSVARAALAIGWSRQKLYRRMVRLGIPQAYGRRADGPGM